MFDHKSRIGLALAIALLTACGGSTEGSDVLSDGGALLADGGSKSFDAGPPEPRPDPSAFLFQEEVVRDYEVTVAPIDWQWLNAHALDEVYVPASVDFEGETFASAAIRYKGGGTLRSCFDKSGNQTCDKVSMKVSFNEYDSEGRFFGLKKLLFHSMIRDPSNMHDALSYKLFRDMGVASPRTAYARLTVNGKYLGLFAFIEYVDGRFTRRVFPDGGKGNLYKSAWPDTGSHEYYLAHLRTNRDESPSADRIQRFATQLMAAGVSGVSLVAKNWQVEDQLMRYMAVARMIDHWDDIGAWYCFGSDPCFNHNFYWYESTVSDQLWLIPWDMDHTLEPADKQRLRNLGVPEWDDLQASCDLVFWFGDRHIKPPVCDTLIRGLAQNSRGLYVGYSQQLILGAFSGASIDARISFLHSIIADEIADDPSSGGVTAWEQAVTELRSTVDSKREFIAGRLAP